MQMRTWAVALSIVFDFAWISPLKHLGRSATSKFAAFPPARSELEQHFSTLVNLLQRSSGGGLSEDSDQILFGLESHDFKCQGLLSR